MSDTSAGATLAIVIPWFGRDLRGGAELHAWNLATRLAARGYRVEVLTTCCGSFQDDWSSNLHPEGVRSEPEGFAIRRFAVAPRDRTAFDRVCGYLQSLDKTALKPGVSPLSDGDERIFCEHLIRCPALLNYLKNEGWRYQAFIFLPYLYGPILDGLPVVASRALLQPCLHDESYAYLRCVQRAVFAAQSLLWLSEGEYELGRRLFGPAVLTKSYVGMAGVEALDDSLSTHKESPLESLKPFVLLLGRKDAGKGTLLATEAFRDFRSKNKTDLNLVIAGPGEMSLADRDYGIHDLGLVTEESRIWLLRNMVALLQPSPNESFSRVMFEAWQGGKPVLARQSCLATSHAVAASGGGWLAETKAEWSEKLNQVAHFPPEELEIVGRRGKEYTAWTADWDKVMDRYDLALKPFLQQLGARLRIEMGLFAPKTQQIRLFGNDMELGKWDLQADAVTNVNWFEVSLSPGRSSLRFETDAPPPQGGTDGWSLGFRLLHLSVEAAGAIQLDLRFDDGWNRSEGGPGTVGPRWSTGTGPAVVQLCPLPSIRLEVHQVLPNLGYGDAIGNHSLWIRNQLRSLGFVSEIYARHIAPEMLHEAYPLCSPETLPPEAAIIYHHSIGTEITTWVVRHGGPKALIYHNITPAEFFAPYNPHLAEICRHGRSELPLLAPEFPISVGDSRFNASELEASGFSNSTVLPLCIDPSHWALPPDEQVMERLQDGRTNILFVGRIVPNKRQDEIIYTFKSWLAKDPEARLFLVGTAEVASLYFDCLKELSRQLQIDHAVHFVGRVNNAQLHAYYRCASMFWCFSEHEGFCVPLVEAMWFDIPVLAYASTAITETLAGAGYLFERKDDVHSIALRGLEILHDASARGKIIESQRKRRELFLPQGVRPHLAALIEKLFSANQLESTSGTQATPNLASVSSIAVVKLDHIGDLVIASPVFAALRQRFPGAAITAVVSPGAAAILQGNPHVDKIVRYDAPWFWRDPPAARERQAKLQANSQGLRELLAQEFDLVVNLRSDHQNVLFAASIPHRHLLSYTNDSDYAALIDIPVLRTEAMHALSQHQNLLTHIGIDRLGEPALYPQFEDEVAVDNIHEFRPGTVALFTGAGIPLKKWPEEKFIELARQLTAADIPVVVVGSKDEAGFSQKLSIEAGIENLCSRFTLPQLAVALSRCSVLVSNDSAPVHIAAAMGTPVVYIIRPLVKGEFAPVGSNHVACCASHCERPCGGFDPVIQIVNSCACIREISVDEVLQKTLGLLCLSNKIALTPQGRV